MSLFQAVPSGYLLTSGANSALTWTNAVSVSSMNVSSLGSNNLSVSTLTTSSSVTASTLTSGSISSNTLTLSLTNASTQNTQIYQVATTNPTTSYTVIQASHVSTGTTNNALALNPSGGNVGIGTTGPQHPLDIVGDMRVGYSNNSSFLVNLGNTGVAGYRSGYLFGNGTDMKLANQQNGALTFDANNVERMRILANGNVGIGYTAPATTLHIVNPTLQAGNPTMVTAQIITRPATGGLQNAMSCGFAIGAATSSINSVGRMNVMVAGAAVAGNDFGFIPDVPVMTLLGSGNVGIGTTTPAYPLHISSTGDSRFNAANFYTGYGTNQPVASNRLGWFSDYWDTNIYRGGGTETTGWGVSLNGTVATNPFLFVARTGTVGIGTTTPDSGYTTTIPNAKLTVLGGAPGQNNGRGRISIGADTSHYSAIEAQHTGAGATTLSLMTCINAATNSGNPQTRMFIDADGKVGIGTTTPTTTLHVLNPTPQAGNTAMVTPQIIGRPATGGVQDGTSCGFAIGAMSALGNSAGRMDIMVSGTTNSGNNWGYTPNIAVATFLGNGAVGIGTTTPSATLQVNGSLAKSSGTFDIGHPLYPDTNKRLVHSFIEGPRCDLIYRGKTTLVNGTAVVNIDKECTHSPECAMDEGTFEALCDNPQIFLQNNQSFDRVRGVIAGATLTIMCETPAAVEIEWMVIAERADPFIKQWDRTNPDGYLVTQYEVEAQSAPTPLSGGASAPTPPSSGEEAAPAASSDAPADPAEDPAASSDAPEASSDPAAPVAPSE